MKKFLLFLFVFIFINSSNSQVGNSPYPIIFVHGINSGDYTWNDAMDFLQRAFSITGVNRFHAVLNAKGGSITNYEQDVIIPNKNLSGGPENNLSSTNVYAINFHNFWNQDDNDPRLDIYSNATPGPNQSTSNESAIFKQAYALKQCIQKVLDITTAEKVILVGHSMGGLAIREYLQRKEGGNYKWWVNPGNNIEGHKVAKVITFGTPHLGTNVPFTSIYNVDPKSEAIRDLRYSYNIVTQAPYLFGNIEANVPDEDYYNQDVNCNGNSTDFIQGISDNTTYNYSLPLPFNIHYTWITSRYLLMGEGLIGDGAVDLDKQWLYVSDFSEPASLSDTLLTDKRHDRETDDTLSIIRGLDEPDISILAYPIKFNTSYSGFITTQMDGAILDLDYYKVSVPESGILTATITGINAGLTGIAVLTNTGDVIATTSIMNNTEILSCTVNSGDYFIRVRGFGDQNQGFKNYNFEVNFDLNGQWRQDVQLVNVPMPWGGGSGYTSFSRSVAASNNIVHVVWHDYRNYTWEIYYKQSTDNGLNWNPDVRLTSNVGQSDSPSIFANGSEVCVVWTDNSEGNFEIYFKQSIDGGLNWSSDLRLTNDNSGSHHPTLFGIGSNIHVVWHDFRDGNWEIYFKSSIDGGSTWGSDNRLTNNSGQSDFPSISGSGSTVNVVWKDNRDGNFEIYSKYSSDNGINWSADKRLSNDPGISQSPSVSMTGQNAHVVWDDNRLGNAVIFYKRSSNSGLDWGLETQLTSNTSTASRPTIISSGEKLHLAWNVSGSQSNIYYKHSSNTGLNWDPNVNLTTFTHGICMCTGPSIAVDQQSVHIVWTDYAHIFYKGSLSQNSTLALMAYYPFNGNTNDESGNNQHGTNIGAVLTNDVFGNSDKSYYFNGIDNYINIPDLDFTSLENISWHALIYPERSINEIIVYYGYYGQIGIFLFNNKLVGGISLSDQNWYLAETESNVELHQWYSVSCVWEKGNSLKLYVNGELREQISLPDLFIGPRPLNHSSLGAYNRFIDNPRPYQGKIDEVRIYSRTLSQSEILSLHNINSLNFQTNLGVAIQGLKSSTVNNSRDTVTIQFRNSISPYNLVFAFRDVLDSVTSSINSNINSNNLQNNIPYYTVINHRNSIETWSALAQSFSNGSLTYNFKSSSSQAFGNNMAQVGSTWCIFSGDVNQDGVIDATDNSAIDNDAYNFTLGYVDTDLTGDNFVDASDAAMGDNNALNFVSVIRP